MAGKKSAEKASRWQEALERQAESGVSIRQFCEAAGLSEQSFYFWRKKLRTATKEIRRPRVIKQQEPEKPSLFVPVKLLDSGPTLEIIHPLGYRIQVTGEVNPVVLRQVIQTLDERSAR